FFSTKMLGWINGVATTYTTVYTVPAGTKTVVTSILICNSVLSSGQCWISCGGIGVLWPVTLVGYETLVFEPNLVMTAGQTIEAQGSTAGAMFVYASGVEITASGTAETFTTKRLAASAPIPTTNT